MPGRTMPQLLEHRLDLLARAPVAALAHYRACERAYLHPEADLGVGWGLAKHAAPLVVREGQVEAVNQVLRRRPEASPREERALVIALQHCGSSTNKGLSHLQSTRTHTPHLQCWPSKGRMCQAGCLALRSFVRRGFLECCLPLPHTW
jgi:hypothetical protein